MMLLKGIAANRAEPGLARERLDATPAGDRN